MGSAVEFTISSEPTGAEAPASTVERPANVPEKFWDAEKGSVKTEDLLKSYSALESKLGSPKPEADPATEVAGEVEGEGTEEESATGDEEADKIVTEAGLDVEAIEAHWLEHNSIPEAELEKLAKVGVTKEMAEEFISYRQAQGDKVRSELMASVGGEDAVNRMVDWASKTFTQEQADAFNAAVNSKDKSRVEMALKALKTDYEKVNGKQPKLLKPTAPKTTAGDRYDSLDQMLKDQADPRYRSDPAFRDAVIAKLSRSNI